MPRTRSCSASTAPPGATRRNWTPISRLAEAEKRDHRKLGRELELFTFSPDVGAGLPLWMPNGMVIRQELEFLALQEERKDGYRRVATPHIAKEALYLPLAPPALLQAKACMRRSISTARIITCGR
jgi:seryl-tRNA synthetase